MNFNDYTVTWDTDTIPMKDRGTLSWAQTLRDEYSQAKKILDAEYKHESASLDDVIKTCENFM
jgi:hypothetical protein